MAKPIPTPEAIKAGLTAQHIATNLDVYEAAKSQFFVFQIDDLSNLLKTNYTGGIDDDDAKDNMYDTNKAEEAIRLNVTKASVPTYKVGTIEYKRGNDRVVFAGMPEWTGSGDLVVDDIVGLDTKSLLYSWLRLAYDPHTFKGGRMRRYKKTCTLYEYTNDYQLVRSWTLYGCFLTSIGEGDFDKESGDDKRQITANISYDRAIMHLPEEDNQ